MGASGGRGQWISREALYDYTGVVNPNANVSPGAAVMVVEKMLTEGARASDEGAAVAVVQAMPAARVVPVLPAAGVSKTQKVRGFLVKAGVITQRHVHDVGEIEGLRARKDDRIDFEFVP